jgi:hypothetical protein
MEEAEAVLKVERWTIGHGGPKEAEIVSLQ